MKRIRDREILEITQQLRAGVPEWEIIRNYGICQETARRIERMNRAIDLRSFTYLEQLFQKKAITMPMYLLAKDEIGKALDAEQAEQAAADKPAEEPKAEEKALDDLRAPQAGEILYTLMQIEILIHDLVGKAKECS